MSCYCYCFREQLYFHTSTQLYSHNSCISVPEVIFKQSYMSIPQVILPEDLYQSHNGDSYAGSAAYLYWNGPYGVLVFKYEVQIWLIIVRHMSIMVFYVNNCLTVCSTVWSSYKWIKYHNPMLLALVSGISWWPVDSPQKGPVMWKTFPCRGVIMW